MIVSCGATVFFLDLYLFFFNLISTCIYLSLVYPDSQMSLFNQQQSFLRMVQHSRFALSFLTTDLSSGPFFSRVIWTGGCSEPGTQVSSWEIFFAALPFCPLPFPRSRGWLVGWFSLSSLFCKGTPSGRFLRTSAQKLACSFSALRFSAV